MSHSSTLTIRNRISEIKHLCGSVQSFVTEHRVAPETAYAVDLVLDELISNIIKYAYDDDEEHLITVQLLIEPTQICVQIEDDGHEFDPLQTPKPDTSVPIEEREIGGLGLYLVREMSQEMTYQRIGQTNRCRVCIARPPGSLPGQRFPGET